MKCKVFFFSAVFIINMPGMELIKKFSFINHGIPKVQKFTPELKSGELKAIKKFIAKHKAAINIPDEKGLTLLNWVVRRKGHIASLRLLLKNGADPNTVRKISPLVDALSLDYIEYVQELLEYGADVNAVGKNNCPAILIAAYHHNVATMELLLKHNVDPNKQDPENGYTSLHAATDQDQKELCELLIKWGADPTITDKENKTARMIAEDHTLGLLMAPMLADAEKEVQEVKDKHKPLSWKEKEEWTKFRQGELDIFLFVHLAGEAYTALTTLISLNRK